ncbi:MAG: peptide deformylase [Candidatus Omnitrophota bacterium]
MAQLEIKKYPNRSLRKKALKVGRVSSEERKILADMTETMYSNNGIGLAAPQVGVSKELIVVDVGDGLVKFINPVLSDHEGSCSMEEGCLSVPDITASVRRAEKLYVTFLDEKGEVVKIFAEGLFARTIQHEIDHLKGRLIVDYLNPIKKFIARKKSSKNKLIFSCSSLTTKFRYGIKL